MKKLSKWHEAKQEIVSQASTAGRTAKEIVEALAEVRAGDYTGLEEASVPLMKRRKKQTK